MTADRREPDWNPTLPPGRIGINFRYPLAIICHFRGENHMVATHPTHEGQAFYCARCGRMNQDMWIASRQRRLAIRDGRYLDTEPPGWTE